MASPKNSSRSLFFFEALLWVKAKSKSYLSENLDFSFLRFEDTGNLFDTSVSFKVR